MNLFPTERSPFACAIALDDKRVVRQASEAIIILSTAAHVLGKTTHYAPHQPEHDLIKWLTACEANYAWGYNYALACNLEYQNRYKHECLSFKYLRPLHDAHPPVGKRLLPPRPELFFNCASNKALGICFRHIVDPLAAYRLYLIERWQRDKRPPTWTGRERPLWASPSLLPSLVALL